MNAAKVEAAVDRVVTEYAASYLLPIQRRTTPQQPGVSWVSGKEVMVELRHDDAPTVRVLVHEIGLLGPLRKQLRSRRVKVEHAVGDAPTPSA